VRADYCEAGSSPAEGDTGSSPWSRSLEPDPITAHRKPADDVGMLAPRGTGSQDVARDLKDDMLKRSDVR
jgi:hypothetical protein